jgi:hypothetical protein
MCWQIALRRGISGFSGQLAATGVMEIESFRFLSSSRAVLCVKQGASFVASLGLLLALCLMLCGVAAAQELSWFDGNRPRAEAWQAIDVLSAAAEEGLDAEHYGAEPLRRAFDAAKDDPALPAESVARLDQDLTEAMLRYLYDVHFGQIDPRRISENFSVRLPNGFNPAFLLQSVVRENRLGEAAILAAPPLPLYANLRWLWRIIENWRVIRFSVSYGRRRCPPCRTGSSRSERPTPGCLC